MATSPFVAAVGAAGRSLSDVQKVEQPLSLALSFSSSSHLASTSRNMSTQDVKHHLDASTRVLKPHWFRSSYTQAFILGLASFCCPGM